MKMRRRLYPRDRNYDKKGPVFQYEDYYEPDPPKRGGDMKVEPISMTDEQAERIYLDLPVRKEWGPADCCPTLPCKHGLGDFARAILRLAAERGIQIVNEAADHRVIRSGDALNIAAEIRRVLTGGER